MGRNIAFLTRLRQIADACEPGAECPTSAVALFNIYLARLYARLDIGQSNRPTHKARAEADSTLAELRLDVLRIEVASARVCADVFAAIRYHIEMARRALAIRITRDDDTQDDWLDGAAVRPSATVLIFDSAFSRRTARSHAAARSPATGAARTATYDAKPAKRRTIPWHVRGQRRVIESGAATRA